VSTNFLGEVFPAKAQRRKEEKSLRLSVILCAFAGENIFHSKTPVKNRTLIHTLIYGLCGGILIVVLRLIEFRFLVIEHSIEIYGGLIAALFAGLGVWLGLKLTKKQEVVVVKEVPVPAPQSFTLNEERLKNLGITRRELEILALIAEGLSNREIAEKLFVSENTVKTHSSRLFDKLSARRRTQAVQIGKEMGLIP
jgi:DNA-binding CsgD family transcriptional regulator